MMNLSCRDMGNKCDYVASGNTIQEVKKSMYDHAAKSHRDMLNSMTEDQKKEMDKKMDDMLAKQM